MMNVRSNDIGAEFASNRILLQLDNGEMDFANQAGGGSQVHVSTGTSRAPVQSLAGLPWYLMT